MKRLISTLAGAGLLFCAQAASASTYLFTFSGGDYQGSFSIDSETVPGYSSGLSATFFNVPVTYDGMSALSTASFYNDDALGGLYLYTQNIVTLVDASGPQLFTGPNNDPQFLVGTFELDAIGSPDIITLTISLDTAGAVPEPASWAMMIGGFGLAGAAMRRRPVKVALAG